MAKTNEERVNEIKYIIESINNCWIYIGAKDRYGYGIVNWFNENTSRFTRQYAHRLYYMRFCGVIPINKIVRHTCDNPSCINPDHLIIGTQRDNVRDMDERGRRVSANQSGESNGNNKLTADQIRDLRSRPVFEGHLRQWSEEFGIHYGSM